jgi:hypothetical protein
VSQELCQLPHCNNPQPTRAKVTAETLDGKLKLDDETSRPLSTENTLETLTTRTSADPSRVDGGQACSKINWCQKNQGQGKSVLAIAQLSRPAKQKPKHEAKSPGAQTAMNWETKPRRADLNR